MRTHHAIIAAGLLVTPAAADTLSSNLDAVSSGSETASGQRSLTALIEAGSERHELTSVTLLLEAGADADAAVYLYSDAGGLEPSTLIATLGSPASLPTELGEAVFTASGLTLEADASYWIVLEAVSGEIAWSWTSDNTGEGAGFTTEWGVSDEDDAFFWWTQDGFPLQFEVTVDEEAECPADLADPAGVLDLADIQAFVTAFVAMGGVADLAPPAGVFDLSDIEAFVTSFTAGCP